MRKTTKYNQPEKEAWECNTAGSREMEKRGSKRTVVQGSVVDRDSVE